MKTYGIIGNPLGHSKSPTIFNSYFKSFHIDSEYTLLENTYENIELLIKSIKEKNIRGFNVTIPYKEDIMRYLDDFDEAAIKIGAVNCVVKENAILKGYNTDFYGFIKSLENEDVNILGKNALVFGTGGVARAICFGLASLGIRKVFLYGRNETRGKILLKSLQSLEQFEIQLQSYPVKVEDIRQSDIIINTTPLGMYPDIESSVLNDIKFMEENKIFYDVVYNPELTKFLKVVQKNNRIISGKHMFIEQAVKTMELFAGYEESQKFRDYIYKAWLI